VSVEDIGAAFVVTDATGKETAYVYLEDEPGRRSAAQARRIAINVARSGDSSCRSSNTISPRHRVHHLVPLGHDQRRLALLVHAAEPAHVKNLLPPLPVTDAIGLAYLHRHAAAWAGVTVAGNYNWLSSFHVPLISIDH
jgi:hypothetical protein